MLMVTHRLERRCEEALVDTAFLLVGSHVWRDRGYDTVQVEEVRIPPVKRDLVKIVHLFMP